MRGSGAPDSREEPGFDPFAFVSALAGALLAVELVRQVADNADTNYLQIDPWRSLQPRARRYRPRVVDCEFCSHAEAGTGIRNMWASLRADCLYLPWGERRTAWTHNY